MLLVSADHVDAGALLLLADNLIDLSFQHGLGLSLSNLGRLDLKLRTHPVGVHPARDVGAEDVRDVLLGPLSGVGGRRLAGCGSL